MIGTSGHVTLAPETLEGHQKRRRQVVLYHICIEFCTLEQIACTFCLITFDI